MKTPKSSFVVMETSKIHYLCKEVRGVGHISKIVQGSKDLQSLFLFINSNTKFIINMKNSRILVAFLAFTVACA